MNFKLFNSCIPVFGTSRSIICDLQRGIYHFIPNSLYEILNKFNGKKIPEVKGSYPHDQHKTIDSYFNFLFDQDLIFFTGQPNLFPELSLEYHSPHLVTNAILEISSDSIHDYELIFMQLDLLGCQTVELRFDSQSTLNDIEQALFPTRLGKLRSIELLLEYSSSINVPALKRIFFKNPRLSRICIHSAPEYNKEYLDDNSEIPILFSSNRAHTNQAGIVDPRNFVCSLEYFIEAVNFNTYFNRKIFITAKGDIKNAPTQHRSFGNITNTLLKDIVDLTEFKQLWAIKKDQIEVCRDCEFRYMCTDERTPVMNKGDHYTHTTSCNYDPNLMKWDDE